MPINLHTHNTTTASHVDKSAQGVDALMDDKITRMLHNYQSHKNLLYSLPYTRMIL